MVLTTYRVTDKSDGDGGLLLPVVAHGAFLLLLLATVTFLLPSPLLRCSPPHFFSLFFSFFSLFFPWFSFSFLFSLFSFLSFSDKFT